MKTGGETAKTTKITWAAVAAVGILGGTSMAFACSPQPRVFSVAPQAIAAGDTTTVSGDSVESGAPVEVRWNSLHGQALGRAVATNGRFSVPVAVPRVAPGIYSLVFVDGDQASAPSGGIARASVEVSAPGGVARVASPHTASPWSVTTSPASHSTGPGLPLGLALAAGGTVALFGGFAAATLRRRRSLA